MNKGILIGIIIAIIGLGLVLVVNTQNSETSNSEISQEPPSPPEGKSFVLELSDSATSSSP